MNRANIHPSNKDDRIVKQWLQAVQNNYQIHRWDLKKALRLSLNDYYRYAPLVKYELQEYITYNKSNQCWMFDGPKSKELEEDAK